MKGINSIFAFFGRKIHQLLPVSVSFSSDGEDYALTKILGGLKGGGYIDIGSYHPIKFSNTFRFYLRGWTGVCVDPLFSLKTKYRVFRPLDYFINAGVTSDKNSGSPQTFYYYSEHPDNSTFDGSRAEALENMFGRSPTSVLQVPIVSVEEVVRRYNERRRLENEVQLLNLDIEGQELSIINRFFELNVFPWVICVEELGYLAETIVVGDVFSLMNKHDYVLVVRTFLTSIYVRRDKIRQLPSPFLTELKIDP